MPGAERAVAHHRRRHDVPAGGLRHLVGGELAAGERAVRKVPQRTLAADRLVDALRDGRRRWRSRRRASRCWRRSGGLRPRSSRRAAAREPPGDRRGPGTSGSLAGVGRVRHGHSKVRGRRMGAGVSSRSGAGCRRRRPRRRRACGGCGSSSSAGAGPRCCRRCRSPAGERAQLGVADDRHRARVDVDALEEIEMHAEGVGDDGLDDVAVAAGEPRRVRRPPRRRSSRPIRATPSPRGPGCRASASPSGPGKTTALGLFCTTFHSGSLASTFSSWPVQSP